MQAGARQLVWRVFRRPPMLRTSSVCAASALCVASAAHASFVAWSVEYIQLGNGHVCTNFYANFDSAADRVLAVTDARMETSSQGGFIQSGSNPTWRPATQESYVADDSFVCIGTAGSGMASSVSTAGGPTFLNFDDSNGATDFNGMSWSGNGASWYNPSPSTNSYGIANNGRVMVAHAVIVNPVPLTWILFDFTVVAQLANGQQVTAGAGDHTIYPGLIPGPAPLVAFALVGRMGNRSRRA